MSDGFDLPRPGSGKLATSGHRSWLRTLSVGLRSVWLQRLVMALATAALIGAAVARRQDLGAALDEIGLIGLLAAMAAGVVALVFQGAAWRELLVGFGVSAPPGQVARAYGVSMIGKYMPGGVWTAAVQVELMARDGASRRLTLGASGAAVLVTVVTGAVVGLIVAPSALPDVGAFGWIALLIVVPLAAVLHPRVLSRLVRVGAAASASAEATSPSARTLARAIGWMLGSWFAYGVHMVALGGGESRELLELSGAYALAFTLGLLFIVAPAGAGIREVVLLAVLGPRIGRDAAIGVALLSRATLTFVDLAVGSASLLALPQAVRRRLARTKAGAR